MFRLITFWGARKTEPFLNNLKNIKAAANYKKFAAVRIFDIKFRLWQPFRRIFPCFP